MIFTIDGLVPTLSKNKTTLIIAKSFSKTNIEDKMLFCLERLKQLPVDIDNTESTHDIIIDGISGYEIVASGKNRKTKEDEKMYQVILFNDSLYYLFYGSTNQDFDNNLNEIRKVVKTFKRK